MFVTIFKHSSKRLVLDTCDNTVTRVTECQFKAYNNEVKIYDYSDNLDIDSTIYSVFKEEILDVYLGYQIDAFLNYILDNNTSISFNILLRYLKIVKCFDSFPSSYKEYKYVINAYNKFILQLKYRDTFSRYSCKGGSNFSDAECVDRFINKFSMMIMDSKHEYNLDNLDLSLNYLYDEETDKVFISTCNMVKLSICYTALLNNSLDRLENRRDIYIVAWQERYSKLEENEKRKRQQNNLRNIRMERERVAREASRIELKN